MDQVNLEERLSGAEWKIWYQDTFDRECPRRVEVKGRGLVEGLTQLWARHLFETVQADDQKGFSRFALWWKQGKRSVVIVGEWEGQVRLRRWVYGEQRFSHTGYVNEEVGNYWAESLLCTRAISCRVSRARRFWQRRRRRRAATTSWNSC